MGFVKLEWFVAMVAVTIGIVAAIAMRKRMPKKPAPDTFQDMSIFDDEVASGNYEIDPVAEAEVYLAYGNKQQAIILLNKAALDNPGRQDILDKIREIDRVQVTAKQRR
jgi:Tfp pilus assembly protein FimV